MKPINWNNEFKDAHKSSGPTTYGLSVSASKPKDGRNIWQEDKKAILIAAKKHGYEMSFQSAKIVSFSKPAAANKG